MTELANEDPALDCVEQDGADLDFGDCDPEQLRGQDSEQEAQTFDPDQARDFTMISGAIKKSAGQVNVKAIAATTQTHALAPMIDKLIAQEQAMSDAARDIAQSKERLQEQQEFDKWVGITTMVLDLASVGSALGHSIKAGATLLERVSTSTGALSKAGYLNQAGTIDGHVDVITQAYAKVHQAGHAFDLASLGFDLTVAQSSTLEFGQSIDDLRTDFETYETCKDLEPLSLPQETLGSIQTTLGNAVESLNNAKTQQARMQETFNTSQQRIVGFSAGGRDGVAGEMGGKEAFEAVAADIRANNDAVLLVDNYATKDIHFHINEWGEDVLGGRLSFRGYRYHRDVHKRETYAIVTNNASDRVKTTFGIAGTGSGLAYAAAHYGGSFDVLGGVDDDAWKSEGQRAWLKEEADARGGVHSVMRISTQLHDALNALGANPVQGPDGQEAPPLARNQTGHSVTFFNNGQEIGRMEGRWGDWERDPAFKPMLREQGATAFDHIRDQNGNKYDVP